MSREAIPTEDRTLDIVSLAWYAPSFIGEHHDARMTQKKNIFPFLFSKTRGTLWGVRNSLGQGVSNLDLEEQVIQKVAA